MSPATATEQKVLEFGPLVKEQLKSHLTELHVAQQTEQVRNAIAILEMTLNQLTLECDPTMIIPLMPRE